MTVEIGNKLINKLRRGEKKKLPDCNSLQDVIKTFNQIGSRLIEMPPRVSRVNQRWDRNRLQGDDGAMRALSYCQVQWLVIEMSVIDRMLISDK